jgi:hypothetical protein
MYNETDEYGVWEVTEGEGYISKINITPTQKYKDENPQLFQTPTPTLQEKNRADIDYIMIMQGL